MEYIAHINGDKIQTVREHCENTAKLAAGFGKQFGAENLCALAGLIHDFGKLTKRFTKYIQGNTSDKRGDIDHSFTGAKYICSLADRVYLADSACKDKYFKVSRLVAHVVVSHHGLHDWLDDSCRDYLEKRMGKSDDCARDEYLEAVAAAEELFGSARILPLLDKAVEEYSTIRKRIYAIAKDRKKGSQEFAFYLGFFERMVQSALIDADRIDTACFMATEPPELEWNTAVLWNNMQQNMAQRLNELSGKTDSISLRRRDISDRCADFSKNTVGVCRLIVPTGGGKTLSGLRFAIDYCAEHGLEKIVYTAPFMSILEQNGDEIRNIAGSENFIEHHSNAYADLSDAGNENECAEYELHAERWDSPVIAVTMVQFFNSLFSAKTTCVRRMHRLAKAVIIIDEVQSIPLKCVNLFNLAMNFLSKICGAAVVLCSATQPTVESTDYPIIQGDKQSVTGDYTKDFEIFHRCDIKSNITPYGMSFAEAGELCAEKFAENGNLLVIVNTKSAALKLYEEMNQICGDKAEVIHLSTNMCPQHRRDKIERMKRLLLENKSIICVTTQLIEAGVDISFRCVVRSAAGVDSAVQAAGRCNRHGECGRICNVYLIKLNEERLGSLKEIKTAQEITQGMLAADKYDNLQSNKAIAEYFEELYSKEKNNLSYPVHDNSVQTSILQLLSLNKERYEASLKTTDKNSSQAFRTAGLLFKVIDDNTTDVIVPYNDDARALINELSSPKEPVSKLLRQAQKYTVSVYSAVQKKLAENSAIYKLGNDILVLDEKFYNIELGVITEAAEQEVLIF